MDSSKVHLCNTCKFNIVTCLANALKMEFGDGVGNDNVIRCNEYQNIEEEEED